MGLEILLFFSQGIAPEHYPVEAECSPNSHIILKIHFSIIFPNTCVLQIGLSLSAFRKNVLDPPPPTATKSASLIKLDFIILIFGENYK